MKKSFGDFFKQQIKDEDNRKLLERMGSLETVTEDGPQTKRPSKIRYLKIFVLDLYVRIDLQTR